MAKYPDSTKASLEHRLHARARERWPQITSLHIRHRGAFSYIDATLTDATTLKLCRLRYVGSAHQWQFAIYRASHDDYDESIFPTGLPIGTCQDALDTACGLYLNDPTAWTRPPTNLRARPLSLELSLVGHSVTPLWAPTGVAVVAILAEGYGLWPAIALAAFAVNVPISPSPVTAVGIAAGNTAAPVLAVWLLRRLQFRTDLARPMDALTLLAAGTVATTISATGGTASLVLSGAVAAGHFGSSWLVWWTGDNMGIVLVAPVLWALRGLRPALTWLRVAEATGLAALLVGTVLVATSRQGPGLFIVFLPLIWIAWRFQQQGAAPAALLTSTLVTLAAVYGQGHFATDSLADRMVTLQCFNATVALTSLFSAAAIAERDGVVGRLRQIVKVAQEAVIRPPAPFVGPVALAARYESATAEAGIGGDLYETADTPLGVRIVIGDVRGKGLVAVQTASAALRAFRRWVYTAPDLADLVAHVVQETEHGLVHDDEEFITALFVEIAASGQLRIVNVGHPAPLHVRGREIRALEPSQASPPVGIHAGPLVPDEFELHPRDRLLLFTDGLIEGRDRAGRFFPLREVAAEILDTEDLDQALDDLMARYLRHVGGRVTDDIAILLAASQPLRLPTPDQFAVTS